MRTFRCPKTSHASNFISTTITSITIAPYVWDMKNFSPLNPKQQPHLEEEEQGGRNIEEISSHDTRRDQQHEKVLSSCIDEDIPRCEWEFNLSTVVSSTRAASDTLGVIEFDPTDTLVATGGIARKIRVYSLNTLVPSLLSGGSESEGNDINFLDHNGACSYYICAPAKLSSLKWRPNSGGRIIGSGDYDGVVTEYDLERRLPTFERDEHGGRRVWSVDYTCGEEDASSLLGASGADDGTMQVWDPRCESDKCVAKVQPSAGGRSSVCCVEFNPFRGSILAVGCADRRAYCYDLRQMGDPLAVFHGHAKTVTYVRFLDTHSLVSASTDGCLKLWDIDSDGNCRHDTIAVTEPVRTYRGHMNTRSFVGLSVWRNGGLLGCGSENNHLYVYDKRWRKPIWVRGFEPSSGGGSGGGFVSSVCWRQVGEEEAEADECTLVAGGSDGVLQVFMGKRKKKSNNIGNDSSAPSSCDMEID